MNLQLEINEKTPDIKRLAAECNLVTPSGSPLMVTPPINEDFWIFRVKVSEHQAIVGFPKFMTIGIGFAVEDDDWNTNLPYTSDAEELYEHIKGNKGSEPTKEDCIAAIKMIQDAVNKIRTRP